MHHAGGMVKREQYKFLMANEHDIHRIEKILFMDAQNQFAGFAIAIFFLEKNKDKCRGG